VKRPCPNCCPQAPVPFYPAEGEHVYRCDNCRQELTIRPRKARIGSPAQLRAVNRVHELLAGTFTIENADDRFWAARGVRALIARGKAWYDASMLIYVGPRGALRVVDCGTNADRRGRKAAIWLEVRSGS
jgi:hypothetical protein